MRKLSKIVLGSIIGLALVINITAGNEGKTNKNKRASQNLEITAKPWGPSQADVNIAKNRVEKSDQVQNILRGTSHRLVSFELLDNEDGSPPTNYRVIFYDYTNDRSYVATGDLAGNEAIDMRQEQIEPGVSREEIQDAFKVVETSARFGELNRANQLSIYEAMPPISYVNGERLVNVGIISRENGENQIVGINFKNDSIVNYESNAPPTSLAGSGSCGVQNSGQGSTGPGSAGQITLTVGQGSATLWEMVVVRPSASSGAPFERSGVEVRDVKYKGKSVLKRGHVPILNVEYVNNVCGPFRDWQYAEGFFDAPAKGASDPVPNIRILAPGKVAKTVVETGDDNGNFQGVAIYQQTTVFGNEVVLVSEMNAGWYRYIMEWRFADDGTIRPRYGFGSVTNSCVCAGRNHHVYWRFDFDIVQPNNKVFKVERGRKFLTPITTETAMFRSYQTNRSLLIQNSNGNEAYQLTPNLTDEEAYYKNPNNGQVSTFGAGDFWVMKFKGTAGAPDELDDPSGPGPAANLSPWINNESVDNQDLVVWYGAHQFRDDASSLTNFDRSGLVLDGVHTVGPDLRPVRW